MPETTLIRPDTPTAAPVAGGPSDFLVQIAERQAVIQGEQQADAKALELSRSSVLDAKELLSDDNTTRGRAFNAQITKNLATMSLNEVNQGASSMWQDALRQLNEIPVVGMVNSGNVDESGNPVMISASDATKLVEDEYNAGMDAMRERIERGELPAELKLRAIQRLNQLRENDATTMLKDRMQRTDILRRQSALNAAEDIGVWTYDGNPGSLQVHMNAIERVDAEMNSQGLGGQFNAPAAKANARTSVSKHFLTTEAAKHQTLIRNAAEPGSVGPDFGVSPDSELMKSYQQEMLAAGASTMEIEIGSQTLLGAQFTDNLNYLFGNATTRTGQQMVIDTARAIMRGKTPADERLVAAMGEDGAAAVFTAVEQAENQRFKGAQGAESAAKSIAAGLLRQIKPPNMETASDDTIKEWKAAIHRRFNVFEMEGLRENPVLAEKVSDIVNGGLDAMLRGVLKLPSEDAVAKKRADEIAKGFIAKLSRLQPGRYEEEDLRRARWVNVGDTGLWEDESEEMQNPDIRYKVIPQVLQAAGLENEAGFPYSDDELSQSARAVAAQKQEQAAGVNQAMLTAWTKGANEGRETAAQLRQQFARPPENFHMQQRSVRNAIVQGNASNEAMAIYLNAISQGREAGAIQRMSATDYPQWDYLGAEHAADFASQVNRQLNSLMENRTLRPLLVQSARDILHDGGVTVQVEPGLDDEIIPRLTIEAEPGQEKVAANKAAVAIRRASEVARVPVTDLMKSVSSGQAAAFIEAFGDTAIKESLLGAKFGLQDRVSRAATTLGYDVPEVRDAVGDLWRNPSALRHFDENVRPLISGVTFADPKTAELYNNLMFHKWGEAVVELAGREPVTSETYEDVAEEDFAGKILLSDGTLAEISDVVSEGRRGLLLDDGTFPAAGVNYNEDDLELMTGAELVVDGSSGINRWLLKPYIDGEWIGGVYETPDGEEVAKSLMIWIGKEPVEALDDFDDDRIDPQTGGRVFRGERAPQAPRPPTRAHEPGQGQRRPAVQGVRLTPDPKTLSEAVPRPGGE